MKDLSLHILDIVQNSTRAGASMVSIEVEKSNRKNLIKITIEDNGCGMAADMVAAVTDPYVTTRTTRKVGMGIPLLKQNCEQSGGELSIASEVGKGTVLVATFILDNLDTPPMGDLAGVIALIASGNPNVEFVFKFCSNDGAYIFDTREVKLVLENTPISDPKIVSFLREMIAENINEIDS